jgi:hypothetical protein
MNAPANIRGVQIHCDYEQGSAKWLEARCGMLTEARINETIADWQSAVKSLRTIPTERTIEMEMHL